MSTKVKNEQELKTDNRSKDTQYNDYCYWKSLPALWRKMSSSDLIDKFGIDDEYTIELLAIKNQNEFAEKYDVATKTLSAWNKRMLEEGNEYLEESRKWAKKLNKNVVMAHYNKLVRKFDPVSGELWYKVIDDYKEKKEIDLKGRIESVEVTILRNETETESDNSTG